MNYLMWRVQLIVLGVAICVGVALRPAVADQSNHEVSNESGSSKTFVVHHSLQVSEVPQEARTLQIWFWLPDEDESQKVLEITVHHPPSGFQISRDPASGNRYLYAEVDHPARELNLSTDFVVRRSVLSIPVDAAHAGTLTAEQRRGFAGDLLRDVPNMEVTPDIEALASSICGNERNVVKEARLLFDWVVSNTKHYSRPGAPKSSGKGSASYCLSAKGGSCTDMHALFISLARARGIPTRLQFGSLLKPENEGKEIDPGYRCWVQYFVPNYGWVSADMAAANIDPARRSFYFSGLDDRRVHFLQGRDLDLFPRQAGAKLNLMIGGYVEVDGKPFTHVRRTMKYDEVRSGASSDTPAGAAAAQR